MKTTLITLAFILASFAGKSQKSEYYKAMGEALGQYAGCRNVDNFRELGNTFNRIANTEKGEWLPLYYHAHCYILMSFMESADVKKKDAYLDEAEKSMNKIVEIAPAEADVFALQAMFYTARLVVNPMERGQQYSLLSGQSVGRALAIDPRNPRARLIKLQNEMGSASFYGKDPNEYCPEAQDLVKTWDQFTPKSPVSPSWGKDQAIQLTASCK